MSTYPASITEEARDLAVKLRAEGEHKRLMTPEMVLRRILVRTAHRLRQGAVMSRSASEDAIKNYFKEIRTSLLKGVGEAEALFENPDEVKCSQESLPE
ncbi:unnamed protein product [Auanema sp. JU1783]|nr:unnamed protein product [Auanema sp. JU1783]